MRRYFGVFFLSAALVGPIALQAVASDRDDHRYYDQDRRDYHVWNNQEDRAYRRYLEERHERYRDWARLSRKQQREYWRWRHSHPDEMLWRGDADRRDRDRR